MSRGKTCLIILLSLLAILSILPTGVIPRVRIPSVHGASHTIILKGAYFNGWNGTNPGPTITVLKGDSVMMSLLSTDGFTHTFVIDVGKTGISSSPNCAVDKCSPSFYSTTVPTSYPFTVDFGPGTYTYYCSIHLTMMMGMFTVTAPGPDYSASSSPSSLTIPSGGHSNSTVILTSFNSFAGTVTLSSSPSSPAGLTTSSFNLNPVMIPAGGTAMSNFTISVPISTAPGLYGLTVSAKNSTTFARTTTISVTVPTPDFSISFSPTSLTATEGSSASATLTIAGSYGFSGAVGLSALLPAGRGTATLNPASVTLSSTMASTTSMLTISSALGKFNATVTATSGSVSHSINVLVSGPDFTITVSPTSLSLNQGSSGTLIVTLSGINGLSGSVSLSANPSSGGLTASLSPNTLQVPTVGSVSSTLIVTASSSGAYSTAISPGSYNIILNATMGSLSHSASIPLTVTSPSFGAGILASPIFIGGVVSTIAVVGVAAYVLSRRAKRTNTR